MVIADAVLGLTVIATLIGNRWTDTGAFAGSTIGISAPEAFGGLSGTIHAAILVGLLSTVVTMGVITFRTAGSE